MSYVKAVDRAAAKIAADLDMTGRAVDLIDEVADRLVAQGFSWIQAYDAADDYVMGHLK